VPSCPEDLAATMVTTHPVARVFRVHFAFQKRESARRECHLVADLVVVRTVLVVILI